MKYLEFLYYKYYNSQVKLGNRNVAPFSAMLIIVFTIMLYYFSFFFLTITFIPKEYLGLNTWFFKAFTIVLFFSLIVGFYFLLLHKGKYKQTIKSQEQIWFSLLLRCIEINFSLFMCTICTLLSDFLNELKLPITAN
jgi:positive regulator of sigma E activity